MKTIPVTYLVEEGSVSPRDNSIGWRPWQEFTDHALAVRAAKELGVGRVLECREVWLTPGVANRKGRE